MSCASSTGASSNCQQRPSCEHRFHGHAPPRTFVLGLMPHRYLALISLVFFLPGCARNIEGKTVGDLTIDQAVAVYFQKPTVADWLTKTNAIPRYIGTADELWSIQLRDGSLVYKEHKVDGVLYVLQLGCHPDDLDSKDRLTKAFAMRAK